MRAAGFRRYGGPDELRVLERPRPVPAAGEVLIRVSAAGVNPADTHLRAGHLRRILRLRLPFVPGCDGAGTVVALDYTDPAFPDHGGTYEVVSDAVGKLDAALADRFIARRGVLVTMNPPVILRHPTWLLPWTSRRAVTVIARPRRRDLDELVRLVDAGRLRVVVDGVHPPAEAADAHCRSEDGYVAGKIILVTGSSGG